jgi:hypothetical protein
MRTPAEQKHVARRGFARIDFNQVSARCPSESLLAIRLGPVGRIGGHRFRFRAVKRAPHAAQEPEAVAADPLERGLVPVGVPIQLRASLTAICVVLLRFRFAVPSVMRAIRERRGVAGVDLAKERQMMVKEDDKRPDTREFEAYLRLTARDLKSGDLPPEPWQLRHSPFEDSVAQRRIATLISRIAAKEPRH